MRDAVTMQKLSVRRRSFNRALSLKERDKDGAPVSSSLGISVGGAKPFEVYGFVGSIGSLVAYAVYIIWAYTPESWLHALGITYYPSRYWAIAVPSYVIISVLFICTLYMSLNFLATHSPQSPYTLYDEYSRPGMDLTLSRSHVCEDERPVIPSFSDMPITEAYLASAPTEREISGHVHTVANIMNRLHSFSGAAELQDRVIFNGIRSLVHSYEMSNPRSVLRVINKCEASLADKAAGLHVRFRLNGDSFPPTVVYKVYTHRPVVDMGSFSPRQYANGPRQCQETYLRLDNNGWRLIIGTPAVQSGPKVKLQAREQGAFFTHSPEERKILKLLDFKKRKRAWLMKLYTESRAATAPAAFPEHREERWGRKEREERFEDTTESFCQRGLDLELLRWSAGLDYDQFEQDWNRMASVIPDEYDRDWCKLGTSFPYIVEVSAQVVPNRSSSVAYSWT